MVRARIIVTRITAKVRVRIIVTRITAVVTVLIITRITGEVTGMMEEITGVTGEVIGITEEVTGVMIGTVTVTRITVIVREVNGDKYKFVKEFSPNSALKG